MTSNENIPLNPDGSINLFEFRDLVDWANPTEFANCLYSLDRDYDRLIQEIHTTPVLATIKWGEGKTLLHEAATDCHLALVEVLLKNGAGVDAEYNGFGTSLHAAVRSQCVQIVEALIKAGASVNAADAKGATPLHEAAWGHESDSIVKLLLNHGANPASRNVAGETPLDIALQRSNLVAARMLLDSRADSVKPEVLDTGKTDD